MAITAAMLKAIVNVEGTPEAQAKLFAFGGKVDEVGKKLGAGLAGAAKIAGEALLGIGVVAVAAGAALVAGLTWAVKGAMDLQDVLTQTVAVLKSTHGASGETAQSIRALALAFADTTRFSAELVQSSENILLTFTRIGKNLFPEATAAVLDFATAMHIELKQASIEVGKALNDPIHGLDNLRRMGVQFTDDQKKVIKALWDTGQTAAAQKLILGELEREFGGSAKAAGTTFAGQLDILKHHLEDAGKTVGTALLPALHDLVSWINTNIAPTFEKAAKWVSDFMTALSSKEAQKAFSDLSKAFGDLGTAIGGVITIFAPLGVHMSTAKDAAHSFSQMIEGVSGFIKTLAADITNAKPTILAIKAWMEEAGHSIKQAWQDMQPTLKTAWELIKQFGAFLRDTFAPAWKTLQDNMKPLKGLWDQLVTAITPAMPMLKLIGEIILGVVVVGLLLFIKTLGALAQGAALAFGIVATVVMMAITGFLRFLAQVTAVVQAVVAAWKWLSDLSNQIFGALISAIVGFFQNLYNMLVGHSIIPNMVAAIIAVFATLPGKVLAAIASLAGQLAGFFNNLAAQAFNWGLHIIQAIANGIMAGIGAAIQAATNVANAVKKILGHSKPEEGPLHDDDVWGLHMAENFARGLLAGSPLVRAAMDTMFAMMGNLNMSHSISGSMAAPVPSFSAGMGMGAPVIHNHIHCDGHPVYVDGRQLTDALGPHLAYAIRFATNSRRPT
jgi:hypothetical protein